MIGVITGDIINSRRSKSSMWLRVLTKELNRWGKSPKQWEVFRGDSFQVEIKKPVDALRVAICIKSTLKRLDGIDVRMAIGIGTKKHNAKHITQSNGTAFINSGELLEELKRMRQTLAVRSGNIVFDRDMNLYLRLIGLVMDKWSVNAAETIYTAINNPGKSQEALGKLLKIKQNAVSTRLQRAQFEELMEIINLYQIKVKELT